MIDIEALEDKFSIEGEVGFAELVEDFVFISVINKFAEADICLYGAQVTNFRPYNTMEMLWLSPASYFEEGRAIRGGIPVCFPWFGPHKSDHEKPQHGFARLMYWDVAETKSLSTGETLVRLQLCSSEKTKTYWPRDFCAELSIIVGKTLSVTLKITNTSSETFEYTDALHSYFSLSALENIAIEGLQNTKYHDQLKSADSLQKEPMLTIQKAETRHYFDTEAKSVIHDSVFGRNISVAKSGSKITTVWNPGEEASSAMDDIPDDGWQTFVCVETVNAFEDTIELTPGKSHETTAVIGLVE